MKLRKLLATCSLIALGLSVSACGGGGGGSGGGGSPVTSTPPPPPPPSTPTPPSPPSPPVTNPKPVTPPNPENFNTAEFRESNGAALAHANAAWAKGATGKGIKIGIVDTGLTAELAEFSGRLDPASRDVAGDRAMSDSYGHGTAVASIAAGSKNGVGVMGVAYDATIVMMKADKPGTCPSSCSFVSDDIAKGIDAARLAGAKVINLSIGGNGSQSIFDAVARATQAGIVVVVAAGNGGNGNPTEMAARIAQAGGGSAIVVGALGLGGDNSAQSNYNQLAAVSNRAGSTQASFLAAPGYLVHGTMTSGAGVGWFTGTSFAAPVVSGAAALLADAFPMLSSTDIVRILLQTADDLGSAGIDSIFGRGRLNLASAFQPIGTVSLAGSAVPIAESIGSSLPSAAGDAGSAGSLDAVVLDDYDRPFTLNIAAALEDAPRSRALESAVQARGTSSVTQAGSFTLALTVDRSAGSEPLAISGSEASAARLLAVTAITKLGGSSSIGYSYQGGAKALTEAMFEMAPRAFLVTDTETGRAGFSAQNPRAAAVQFDAGNFSLSAAMETGLIAATLAGQRDGSYRSTSVAINRPFGWLNTTLSLTRMAEEETLLGGRLGPNFGRSGAYSHFADAEMTGELSRGWSFTAAARRGWTSFGSGNIRTSSYSLLVSRSGLIAESDVLTLRLAQPLRIDRGGITASMPTAYDYRTGEVSHAPRTLSLSPSGREWLAEVGYARRIATGTFNANLFARHQPSHSASSGPDIGGAVRFKLTL